MARQKMRVLKAYLTKNWVHLRFQDPKRFATCRNIPIGRYGRRLIVCCPKGAWNAKAKRCRVGLQRQAILEPRMQ